jgi:peptide deformylase
VAKLDIITLPDRKLRLKSAPVERIDDASPFMDSMRKPRGAGHALRVQVNAARRIVTIDVAQREDETRSQTAVPTSNLKPVVFGLSGVWRKRAAFDSRILRRS